MQSLGVIFGNRDFFPDHLVAEARRDLTSLFAQLKVRPVMVSESDTKLGGVETFADARKCVFSHCGNWAKSLNGGQAAAAEAPAA